jgi:RiboL-PSP-HEPN
MASNSFRVWRSSRARALDEMENADASIGGTGRGRCYATQQVNQAYAVMVASQFQGFCRDLHTESVTVLVDFISPPALVTQIIRNRFVDGRQLESKNAQPSSLGSDFGWFGVEFWKNVNIILADDKAAQNELGILNDWRNAIAHQNFKAVSPGFPPNLTLKQVRQWRRLCNRLASAFDRVMRDYLESLSGVPPWPA